jgi:hypothetical protein
MYKTSTLLVISDYEAFQEKYQDPENRCCHGVVFSPVKYFDEITQTELWCLSIEWEKHLKELEIAYQRKQITYFVDTSV